MPDSRHTDGVGAALRMLYRPVRLFHDAFDFLSGETDEQTPAKTAAAIEEMRVAANRLQLVAGVSARNGINSLRAIREATDEAARFDA